MECVHGALKLVPATGLRDTTAATRLAAALLARQFPVVSPEQQLVLHTA